VDDQSVSGCGHACLYRFTYKTHRCPDLNTGLGFDSHSVVKVNRPEPVPPPAGRRRAGTASTQRWLRMSTAIGGPGNVDTEPSIMRRRWRADRECLPVPCSR
jgi:hypothetical protein